MNNPQRIGSSILRFTTGLALAVATTASAQTYTLLRTFAGSPNDGVTAPRSEPGRGCGRPSGAQGSTEGPQ
jgi:hypothetical protein